MYIINCLNFVTYVDNTNNGISNRARFDWLRCLNIKKPKLKVVTTTYHFVGKTIQQTKLLKLNCIKKRLFEGFLQISQSETKRWDLTKPCATSGISVSLSLRILS